VIVLCGWKENSATVRKGHKDFFFRGEIDVYVSLRKPKGEKAFIATRIIGVTGMSGSAFYSAHVLRYLAMSDYNIVLYNNEIYDNEK